MVNRKQARRKLFVIGGAETEGRRPESSAVGAVGGGGPGACSPGKFLNLVSVKCHFMGFGGKI